MSNKLGKRSSCLLVGIFEVLSANDEDELDVRDNTSTVVDRVKHDKNLNGTN